MPSARFLLIRHPGIVAALLFCALIVRVLVPAGYMPASGGGTMTLQLCSGRMLVTAAVPGMPTDAGKHEAPVKTEQPCAFSGAATPALGSADLLLLGLALAFVLVLALRGRLLALPLAPARLRPPMRAPPSPGPLAIAGPLTA